MRESPDLQDTLTAAQTNAFVEGAGATDPVLGTPTRNYSIVQCFQKHYHVSGRQEAVRHAGMSSMLSYQDMKKAREVKTDVELALHRGSAVSGNSGVAPQLAGILNFATTYNTARSGITLTEREFNDRLTDVYATPVNLREVYSNMLVKRTINQYTTNTQRYIPAESKKQLNVIDVYESEMGLVALFKSRYQLQGAGVTASGNSWVAIDPDFWKVGVLRPFKTTDLGLDGDRKRRLMVGELTLIGRADEAAVVETGVVPYLP